MAKRVPASQNLRTVGSLKRLPGKFPLIFLSLWIGTILAGIPHTTFAASIATPSTQASTLRPSGLISRGVPAYSSSGQASDANSASYATYFRESVPGWLAYDLSSVPLRNRADVVVAYFNDTVTYHYDHVLVDQVGYDNLGSYTIDANAAPGGSAPPQTGWVTLATITNNTLHSRQNVVHMKGYNWLRLNITQSDGSPENYDAMFKMDVYDAHQVLSDDWIFLGDSITANIMHHGPIGTTGNFSQLINAAAPTHFPLQEDGGIGGVKSGDGAAHIDDWLSHFPGKYVDLSYGTNDAGYCDDAATFQQNMMYMVHAILSLHKIPIIPHIPWAPLSSVQTCGPALNAVIDQMYRHIPQIIRGPDLWALFLNRQELFADVLHPNTDGEILYRQAWVHTALKVYATKE